MNKKENKKLYALTKNGLSTGFVFSNEAEAKQIADCFEKRNKRLMRAKKLPVENRSGKISTYKRIVRHWDYTEVNDCTGLSADEIADKYPNFGEHDWIVDYDEKGA